MSEHSNYGRNDAGQSGQSESIRACMISYYFPPNYSGSALQALGLCKELKSVGVHSIIVSANLSGSASEEQVDGIELFRLDISARPGLQIFSFWLALARFLWKRRNDYDVIHAHGTMQHAVAGAIGRLLGKPSFLKITMAGSDLAFENQGRLWGRLQRFLASKFDKYIAISSDVRRELLSSGLCVEEDILSIPNGVDMTKFGELLTRSEKDKEKRRLGIPFVPVVLFVGIIQHRKNLDTIMKAWQLAKSRGCPGYLVCVGPTPESEGDPEHEYYVDLLRFVEEHDLRESVCFAGHQTDPVPYYQVSDIFFFPSRREGMPNAVLEGMAAGLPCLVSDCSGAIDLVDHDVTGFIEKPDAVEDFAMRLEALLLSPELRDEMGRESRQRANRDFSLSSVASRANAAYRLALS